MSLVQAPKVCICCDDEAAQRRITDAFADSVEVLTRGTAEFEVLITDRHAVNSGDEGGLDRAKVPVLHVGSCATDSADLSLPTDFTPRDLQTACFALGEV